MDGGNYLVVPYVINRLCLEQFHDLRTTLLKSFIQKSSAEIIYTNHSSVYAYLFKKKGRNILIVVNSTEEDFVTTELKLQNITFNKILHISRKDGKKRNAKFDFKDNILSIKLPNEHLTTQTIILK